MKKLLIVAAMAGGLTFAGLSDLANADHRGRSRYRANFHSRHHNNWNRGFHNQRYNFNSRYRYNNRFYGPQRGVNFRLNIGGGYPGYGYYGPGYGFGNDFCW